MNRIIFETENGKQLFESQHTRAMSKSLDDCLAYLEKLFDDAPFMEPAFLYEEGADKP